MRTVMRFVLSVVSLFAYINVCANWEDNLIEVEPGMFYNVISEEGRTVEFAMFDYYTYGLANGISEGKYSEHAIDLIIPSKISLQESDGGEYDVVSIGARSCCIIATGGDFGVADKTEYRDYGRFSCFLKYVDIPETVVSVGEYAFAGAHFEEIRFPSSVESMGYGCLHWSPGLKRIYLPEGLKEIPVDFASMCKRLEECEIPPSVEKIGSEAFYRCNSLRRVFIPASVKEIGWGAFTALVSLKEFEVDPANGHFRALEGALVDITGTKLVACPVAENDVKVPEGVEEILSGALVQCYDIVSLDLPSTLKSLADTSFDGDPSLQSVTVRAAEPPACPPQGESLFEDEVYRKATLYVPEGCVDRYKKHRVWGKFKQILEIYENGVEGIGEETGMPRYYTIDGIRVDAPKSGNLLIRVCDGRAEKIRF